MPTRATQATQPRTSTLIFAEAMPLADGGHPLNWIAAMVSSPKLRLCHVEISIGSVPGKNNTIGNVLRVYSGETVELCQRTGLNPSLKYVEVTHSPAAEHAMLQFAKAQSGKRFDMSAMVRSPCLPRSTTENTWFCAELTAATLKSGGLLPADTNPAGHTPDSLYRHFADTGATTGNPHVLRRIRAGATRLQLALGVNPARKVDSSAEYAAVADKPQRQLSCELPIHAPGSEVLRRVGPDDFLRDAVRHSGVLQRPGLGSVVRMYEAL